ncbi:DMT family transporter [Telmatospirillum siberiense]|uniref:EamA family transporter n=1 Tax=Telmatospirillum siberiense TaxID=382514 RepID=A0A2N3PPG4_9PROT|nr:DMT family transporter [Telmatospirillum siberiense]PKU22290.1 EamA family transporter [Telmatospirillum siberiense]
MQAKATRLGIGALLLWSTLALLSTLTGTVPPFQLVGMAFALATLVAVVKWCWSRQSPLTRLRQPLGAWMLGVAGLFGYHFFYFLALRLAPPVEANLLNYLWPLLIVVFSALLPGQRLRAHHLAGAVAGLAGAALLIAKDGGAAFAGRYAVGYGSALACAVIWAAYSVANRRYKAVPSDAVGGFCGATALLALFCHLAFEETVMPVGGQWLAILALGLGPVGAAFFLWDHACKHGDLSALGNLAYGVPLLSNGLLIAAGRGTLTWQVAVAVLLIVGGAILGTGTVSRMGHAVRER